MRVLANLGSPVALAVGRLFAAFVQRTDWGTGLE